MFVTLENIREIRATNQEDTYLKGLYKKIDAHESVMIRGELISGIFVNAASVIMRLGVATTILVGANLIVHGQIDFMILFMFLLVITRIYAPFDQSLALIAEMFVSQVSANRMMEIYDTPIASGKETFEPKGYDIEFHHVSFSYDNHDVLKDVSFIAKEGEVTALVGPSGSGKSTCAKLAARLWDTNKGSIKVGGIDINTIDPEVLLSDYSMVFQDVVLFDDSIKEKPDFRDLYANVNKHGNMMLIVPTDCLKDINCKIYPCGNQIVTLKDNVSNERFKELELYLRDYGRVFDFEDFRENSLVYINGQLIKLVPMLICVIVLVIVSSVSASAVNIKKRLGDYGIYYLCGAKWNAYIKIDLVCDLMTAVMAAAIAVCISNVLTMSEFMGNTVISFGWLHLIGCVCIVILNILISLLIPGVIMRRNTPNEILMINE